MKESRKPLEERIGYKIWKIIDNHAWTFCILVIVLTMGIGYLIFSVSQQEAYDVALASYDREQYEKLDEVITKNMQNGFPNIPEVPEDIKFSFNKPEDSDNISYTFSKEVKDIKSWLIPDLTIAVKISKSGELLSKTSCYETEESYKQEIQECYGFCKVFMLLIGGGPVAILILVALQPFYYYWEKEEVKEWIKKYEEIWKRLAEFALDKTDEGDDEEDIKLAEIEPEDNDE